MPSPFPGMNPYIEQDAIWQSFHLRFLAESPTDWSSKSRPNYIIMIDEHIHVHELPDAPRRLVGRADISVAARPRSGDAGPHASFGDLEAPSEVHLPTQDTQRVPFLEVRDRQSRELIAVLDLLSPSNKRGGPPQPIRGRAQSIAREHGALRGDRPAPRRPADAPGGPAHLCLFGPGQPGEGSPRAGFWPIGLRKRLPIIPIPLRAPTNPRGSTSRKSSTTSTTRPATRTSSTPERPSPPLGQGCRLGPPIRADSP